VSNYDVTFFSTLQPLDQLVRLVVC